MQESQSRPAQRISMTMTLTRKRNPALPASPAESAIPDLEALFQQHWEGLCRAVYRLVGDRLEAEDLVLEAFVQLYRRPPAQADNLAGWLYRVAVNLGLNTLRARKRRLRYEEQAGALDQAEGTTLGDPAAAFEQAQEHQHVRLALGEMRPRSAQLLLLRHSGLSYAEIAAALELAPASVGALLARAEKEFERIYERG